MFVDLSEKEISMLCTAVRDRQNIYEQQKKTAKKKDETVSAKIEQIRYEYGLLYKKLNNKLKKGSEHYFIVYSRNNNSRKKFASMNKAMSFAAKEKQIYVYEQKTDRSGNTRMTKYKIINRIILEITPMEQ